MTTINRQDHPGDETGIVREQEGNRCRDLFRLALATNRVSRVDPLHIAEHAFDALDAPPALIAADDTPIPYSGSLEDLWMPTEERIADGIRLVAAL